MNPMILVVDDEESIRKLLRVRLTREGYSVQEAENGKDALKKVEIYDPLAVVSDIRMPEMDGFEFLDELSKKENAPSVVLITGHGEKECAIQAVRTGAYDYIEKPFDLDQVVATVKRAVEATNLKRQNVDLMSKLEVKNKSLSNTLVQRETELKQLGVDITEVASNGLLGESQGISEVRELIRRITPEGAKSEDDYSTVLITGESGTGKEVAARMIHDCSARKNGPFIAVNCAAFSENLLESELFGHEKGAFTGASDKKAGLFEAANGGTIFLDEIGESDPRTQASLLRVLQEKCIRRVGSTKSISVDVRVLSATNRDLKQEVNMGSFREDLYYRLNVLHVHLPPLRERGHDIEILSEAFINRICKARKIPAKSFGTEALRAMNGYTWPGNIRELQNIIERAVILSKENEIQLSDLALPGVHSLPSRGGAAPGGPNYNSTPMEPAAGILQANILAKAFFDRLGDGNTFRDVSSNLMEEVEMNLLKMLLEHEKGNVSKVARLLGLDRSNVQRRLKKWDISPTGYRKIAA